VISRAAWRESASGWPATAARLSRTRSSPRSPLGLTGKLDPPCMMGAVTSKQPSKRTPAEALFRKVDCLSIPVPDLDAALAFYSGNLRHELIWRSDTAAGLRLPDSSAELVLHTDDRPMETDLSVESVPEALEKFTSAGGKVLAGPFEIPIGLCAVVSDPWDNALVILDVSKGHLRVDENRRVIEGPVT
jgi:lactoylglutathione lyase